VGGWSKNVRRRTEGECEEEESETRMRIFKAEEIFECMRTDLSILVEKHENEDLHKGAYKGPFRVRQRSQAHDPLGTYMFSCLLNFLIHVVEFNWTRTSLKWPVWDEVRAKVLDKVWDMAGPSAPPSGV